MELQLRKVQLATDMVEGQISDFNHYQKIVGMAEGLMQADAIVNGIIEQIGTPLELYRGPKNIFVAGFIGSPKMNLISGEFADKNNAHTIGIRPEHIAITQSEGNLIGEIKMSESLGSDTFVHVEINNFQQNITVRAEGEKNFIRGEKINLNYNKENLHLFNEVGERI